ncbi:MAG TPA: hypothetical protein VFV47_12275 [Hyphomicrobiaceae bacterium]|nr:hypothetical protein [Hyphomicrobiaceae bacterium]
MDKTMLVFVAGTSISFFPMYWLLTRLLGNSRKPALAPAPLPVAGPTGRDEFMNLLRQEVAHRAIAVLSNALLEVKHAAQSAADRQAVLSVRTRDSLNETRLLVEALLPNDLRQAFARGLETITTARAQSMGAATVAIAATHEIFERAIQGHQTRQSLTQEAMSGSLPALVR